MVKKVVVCLVMLLLLVSFAAADTPIKNVKCAADLDCKPVCDISTTYTDCYCSKGLCYSKDAAGTDTKVDTKVPLTKGNETTGNITQKTVPSKNITTTIPTTDDATIKALETSLISLKNSSASTAKRLSDLETAFNSIQGQLGQLQTTVNGVASQQAALKGDVETTKSSVSTGLAGLQQNLKATEGEVDKVEEGLQKEQSFTTLIKVLFLIAVVLGVIAGVLTYLQRTGGLTKVDPQITKYITSHVAKGGNYPELRRNLLKAGWPEDQIAAAYKKTMKENYSNYKGSSGGSAGSRHKVLIIVTFTIVLLLGGLLIFKGANTGHAIFFKDDAQFDQSAKRVIQQNIQKNQFYPLWTGGSLCIQVDDGLKRVSYMVLKGENGHVITEPTLDCEETTGPDFSMKFADWDSFTSASLKLTCDNIAKIHKAKGMYVLPSEYVASGFSLNPGKDIKQYCPVLLKCMTQGELAKIGITC